MMLNWEEAKAVGMKNVCCECIGEDYLQKEIFKNGVIKECHYCHKKRKATSIHELANLVHFAFEDHYGRTTDQPIDGLDYQLAREGKWERSGDELEYIMHELLELEDGYEGLVDDLISYLQDLHYDHEMAVMGEEQPYDSDAQYILSPIQEYEFSALYQKFEKSIKKHRRFINTEAVEILKEIFDGVENYRNRDGVSVIVDAGPEKELTGLYRARVAMDKASLETILFNSTQELAPPPSEYATSGRMNPHGISIFYGASSPETTIAEVRPFVGSNVVVGRFNFLQDLKLLNIESLRNIRVSGSYFDPKFARDLERVTFLEVFASLVSTPIMPHREALDYLPTQVVAEFLSEKFDGIIFRSAQDTHNGQNIILFNQSAGVEIVEVPSGTDQSLWSPERSEYEKEYSIHEIVPAPDENAVDLKKAQGYISAASIFGLVTDKLEPSLKLDEESLQVFYIDGVKYDAKSAPVKRHRNEKNEYPDF